MTKYGLKKPGGNLFKGTLIDLLEGVYSLEINPIDAQKVIHTFFCEVGLNPAVYEPLSSLLLSSEGKDKIERYEMLMNEMNWLIARLSGGEIDIDESLEIMEEKMSEYLNGDNESRVVV
ncbi:MAG: hypothetical protein S4CHLAM20_09130 [Chlamydiia bacterium]|nr:hypothetical protein [Chlamydiia bacterium]